MMGQTADVEHRAEELVQLFAARLQRFPSDNDGHTGEGGCTKESNQTERGDQAEEGDQTGEGGYTEVGVQPGRGIVTLTYQGQAFVLNFGEAALLDYLEEAVEFGPDLWGPQITPLEAAVRLLTIHWEASVETREPHVTGQWTYDGGGFAPWPPWESHAR